MSQDTGSWVPCKVGARWFHAQGKKRTKLGLREFIKLGSFKQIIDTDKSEAVSIVEGVHVSHLIETLITNSNSSDVCH